MRARNVCVASVDLFSQNSAVATAAREDGIQCVTLLTYLAAAQIYRTNRSRHYRVMVLDNAHHSTPAGFVSFFLLFTCLPVLHGLSPSPLRIVAAYIHLPSSSFVCFRFFGSTNTS
uniref:Uncharacterized protein n=1 Tax=Zea mays TaxID=4577 RepID=B4FP47_MAIZE|nr:unknown [Zea mays]ACG40349.1 hypothetical protein [Zea mays]